MNVKINKEGKTRSFKLIRKWSDVTLERWLKLVHLETDSKSKEAIDTIVAKLNEESAYNQMMDMLYAGVSIESLVNTLTFVGFMNGLWSPDVAEGAKIPLFFWIMAQAAKSGLRPRLYNNLRKTDIDTNRIMKTMQPNEYKKTLAEAPAAPVEELPEEQPQEAVGEPFMTMEE